MTKIKKKEMKCICGHLKKQHDQIGICIAEDSRWDLSDKCYRFTPLQGKEKCKCHCHFTSKRDIEIIGKCEEYGVHCPHCSDKPKEISLIMEAFKKGKSTGKTIKVLPLPSTKEWEEKIFLQMVEYAKTSNPAIGDVVFGIVNNLLAEQKAKSRKEVIESATQKLWEAHQDEDGNKGTRAFNNALDYAISVLKTLLGDKE